MIYVMSNLNGKFEEFFKMLSNINFKKEDKLYILGNSILKGPDGIKLLLYIMENNNIKLLLGEDELTILKALKDLERKFVSGIYREWINNQGIKSLEDFERLDFKTKKNIYYYLLNIKNTATLKSRRKSYLLDINGFNKNSDNIIIYGNVIPGEDNVDKKTNRLKKDKTRERIGIYYEDKITCLRLNDLKLFQL